MSSSRPTFPLDRLSMVHTGVDETLAHHSTGARDRRMRVVPLIDPSGHRPTCHDVSVVGVRGQQQERTPR
jgi:hypothetical protein